MDFCVDDLYIFISNPRQQRNITQWCASAQGTHTHPLNAFLYIYLILTTLWDEITFRQLKRPVVRRCKFWKDTLFLKCLWRRRPSHFRFLEHKTSFWEWELNCKIYQPHLEEFSSLYIFPFSVTIVADIYIYIHAYLCIVYYQTMPFTMPIVQQCQKCVLFLSWATSLRHDHKMCKIGITCMHKGHCSNRTTWSFLHGIRGFEYVNMALIKNDLTYIGEGWSSKDPKIST